MSGRKNDIISDGGATGLQTLNNVVKFKYRFISIKLKKFGLTGELNASSRKELFNSRIRNIWPPSGKGPNNNPLFVCRVTLIVGCCFVNSFDDFFLLLQV
jgi:hypothetical protein